MAVMKRLPGRGPNSVGDGRTALFTSTLKGWPSRRCLSYLKPFFCQSLSVSRDLNGLSGHDHREENLAGSLVLQEGTFGLFSTSCVCPILYVCLLVALVVLYA